MLYKLRYELEDEFPGEKFDIQYAKTKKWYLPASGIPWFDVEIYKGSVRRIQYTMNNTDPTGYQPPPCFIDWPADTYKKPTAAVKWTIDHCKNVTEDTYDLLLSVWNPMMGWMSSKPTVIEVLERVGPITIDDFRILSDYNETKPFKIRLAKAGIKTCIVTDYGDSGGDFNNFEFRGNLRSCRIRFPTLSKSQVLPFDSVAKEFDASHTYIQRNLYRMHVFGFDERNYAEAFLDLTIFRMPCTAPKVWLPKNQTSFLKWDAVPMVHRSKSYQVAAKAQIECNGSIPTFMSWRVFEVEISDDPDSQIGKKEKLTPIPINETIPSWNSALLDIPKLTFMYGLKKLVFRFEVETGNPDIPFYKEAHTYVNITKSPLMPVLIEGSAALVSRGWGQFLTLTPAKLSIDPDFPDERKFNFTWFCRVVAPEDEYQDYANIDSEGYPLYEVSWYKTI